VQRRMMKKSSLLRSSSANGLPVSVEMLTISTRQPSPVCLPVVTRPSRLCQYQYMSWNWPTFHRRCACLQHCHQNNPLGVPTTDLSVSAVLLGWVSRGLTSHSTLYRSFWDDFTGQMTQPTASNHRRKPVSCWDRLPSHQNHSTVLQYKL